MHYHDFDKKLARREYYTNNFILWGVFIAFIPGVQILSYLFVDVFKWPVSRQFIGFGWFVAWVVAVIRHATWKCPRCHKPFYHKWWYGNAFSTKCLHCGLRPGDLREDFLPK
jgi:hypothetical protein